MYIFRATDRFISESILCSSVGDLFSMFTYPFHDDDGWIVQWFLLLLVFFCYSCAHTKSFYLYNRLDMQYVCKHGKHLVSPLICNEGRRRRKRRKGYLHFMISTHTQTTLSCRGIISHFNIFLYVCGVIYSYNWIQLVFIQSTNIGRCP